MRRIALVLVCCLIVALAPGMTAAAANPARPRPAKPVAGVVVEATADSLTVLVRPPPPPRPRVRRGDAPLPDAPRRDPPPPVKRGFAIGGQTEMFFAEVRREMPMDDGTVLRAFDSGAPAVAADLKPGLNVEVTAAPDGVASRVVILWAETGTLVRVAGDSLVFRPDPPPGAAAGDAPPPKDRTLTAGDDSTSVRFEEVAAEQRDGRRVVRVEYRRGALGDLKPGQRAVVCVRDGAAVRVRVLPAPPPAPDTK